jgi:hypothetical protein
MEGGGIRNNYMKLAKEEKKKGNYFLGMGEAKF